MNVLYLEIFILTDFFQFYHYVLKHFSNSQESTCNKVSEIVGQLKNLALIWFLWLFLQALNSLSHFFRLNDKNGQTYFNNFVVFIILSQFCGIYTAKFAKCVWTFLIIIMNVLICSEESTQTKSVKKLFAKKDQLK